MAVTGTVYSLIYEADGDIHIRLTVDSAFTYMLNAANYSGELGRLVCEPICATTITQTDAIGPCSGLTNTVYIPNVNEHVQVTGSYVTDNDHGWNEIHPISKIVLTSAISGIAGVNTSPPLEVAVFPNPATNYVNFTLSGKPASPVYITILSEAGRMAGQYQMLETLNLKVKTTYLPSGTYYYHVEQADKRIQAGSFIVVN